MKKKNRINDTKQSETNIKNQLTDYSVKNNYSIIYLIIVFCLPVLLYLQTINFGYTYFDDDSIIIKNISFLGNIKNAGQVFLTDAFINNSSSFYRPMQTLSFMTDILFSGGSHAWMYHLTNVFLIGMISCLLFILLIRFHIPLRLALLGTLIYCIHPLFVSSVAWLPGRGDLLLTFFALLSFISFVEYQKKGENKYLIINWAAFTIALFCKETAVMLPLLFILYFFTFLPGRKIEKKYLFVLILYTISGILWFWLRYHVIGGISNSNYAIGLKSILLNSRVIPETLTTFLLPFYVVIFPTFSFIKTLVGIIIIGLIIFFYFKKSETSKKEKLFCLAWCLILILPPLLNKDKYFDYLNHRSFLPLIGLLIFILFMFPKKWFINGNNKRYWLLVAVIILLSSFTFIKSRSYSNPMTFYNSAIIQNPNSAVAYFNRGCIRMNKNNFKGAVEDYNKAISISPNYIEAYNNRGYINLITGNFQGAIDDYNKTITINQNDAKAYSNRGYAKANLGDKKGALEDYKKAISICPKCIDAYMNIGTEMAVSGNYDDAIKNFNKAVELEPDNWKTYDNRAIAKYSTKDYAGAIKDWDKVLELNPNSATSKEFRLKAIWELKETGNQK